MEDKELLRAVSLRLLARSKGLILWGQKMVVPLRGGERGRSGIKIRYNEHRNTVVQDNEIVNKKERF